jgi:lipoprotein-anchoring transpeptidase ErfK/SrfK
MTRIPTALIALATTALALPAAALTHEAIEGAAYEGGALPDGQSGTTFAVQVLLDRAGISPGVIDGYAGGMSTSAIAAFEAREGLEVDGAMDMAVWEALGGPGAGPVVSEYEITEEDAAGLVDAIPDDVREKAAMEALSFTSVPERLAERFHMDEDVLRALNQGTDWSPGATVTVADPGARLEASAARVEVRKADSRAVLFDEGGAMIASYPVTVGSDSTPSPEGTVEVTAIAMDPTYSYRPDVNFTADGVDEALTLPPGPNGPVGVVWIDLSEPTYGLHGTDDPAELFQTRSHGCVRFTNWDIVEVAHMVSQGVTVEFVE